MAATLDPADHLRSFYEDDYDEDARLPEDSLEWLRTTELIGRVLPVAPCDVADVACGTGRYAAWLAAQGHRVAALDLVPTHVAATRQRAADAGLPVTAVVGDARALPWPDAAFDVVLILGALYHLQDAAERARCLVEARRVLRPGGALVAAYVNRWASLIDGYRHGLVGDPPFQAIVDADLATGRHENPDRRPGWFTTAYFHTPDEALAELDAAGFAENRLLAVEGFASATGVPDALDRAVLLEHLRRTEGVRELWGASAHLLSLSVRPSQPTRPARRAATANAAAATA